MEGQVTDKEQEVIITNNNLLPAISVTTMMTCWFLNNGKVH